MTDLESVSGVGPAAAKKLREVFVTTAELLAVQNPVELQAKTKLGEGTVDKIIKNARELVGTFGFKSGLEVEQDMAELPRLSTGISKLDDELLGGIEIGSIVEFFGPSRGGKTQWAAQLAVMTQLPLEQGGLDGRVLWLDSESSFKPWIIRANAIRFGMDPDVALGNIGRAQIILSSQLMDLFDSIPQLCAENDYKLVIVDSLTGLFRVEYTGLEMLKVRQQDMNGLLNTMRRTASATNTIFAYTNHVMAKISLYGGNPNHPVGGHTISHASDYRFYTRRSKKDKRKLDLQDNAGVPEFSFELTIGWGGFYGSSAEKKEVEPKIKEYFDKHGFAKPESSPDEELEEDIVAAGEIE
ncbi:MAG: DNA repair and recombination protein RadA [Candidatus Thorarchaeota archaeon]|nr:MAG: DNA repair and recombination protein RadA [Candidatus Thorarchaeota archaeon]